MALFDIVISDDITISDVIARQLNAGQVARFFDIQINDKIEVTDALTRDVIISDTIGVTDSIVAIIIDTLSIANARALTDRKIRIDFSAAAKAPASNPALSDPASYVFTPISPGAVSVVPQSVDLPPGQTEPLYVEVNLSEHTNGLIYEVGLSSLILGANDEVGGGAPFAYAGIGASPIVLLVLATSPTECVVQFDEAILDNPSANDVANYVWDNGLATVAVKSVIGNLVTLQTTPQTGGALYNLTVRGVFGIVISDTIQVTDNVPIINFATAPINDAISVTDQLRAEASYSRTISDAVAVVDAIGAEDITLDVVISDTIEVTDVITPQLTVGASGDPSTIIAPADQLLWFDAAAGVTTPDSNVTNWADQYSAVDLVNPFFGEPTHNSSGGINSTPVVLLADGAQSLSSATANLGSALKPYVWIVGRNNATTTASQEHQLLQVVAGAENFVVDATVSGGPFRCFASAGGGASIAGTVAQDTSYHVFEAGYDGVQAFLQIDHGTVEYGAPASSSSFGWTSATVKIGATADYAGGVDVCEVIMMAQQPSGAQKSQVNAYLLSKYGI